MLANVGFRGFRSAADMSAVLLPKSSAISSLVRLLLRLCDADVELVGPEEMLLLRLVLGAPRRKMWTVSVAEETLRRVDVELNDMLNIRAGIDPLRNW